MGLFSRARKAVSNAYKKAGKGLKASAGATIALTGGAQGAKHVSRSPGKYGKTVAKGARKGLEQAAKYAGPAASFLPVIGKQIAPVIDKYSRDFANVERPSYNYGGGSSGYDSGSTMAATPDNTLLIVAIVVVALIALRK